MTNRHAVGPPPVAPSKHREARMDRREHLIDIMEEAAKGETKATLRARIAELEAKVERLRKALGMMLKEHDILSGNFGDVMDPKHKRPDRWPTAAEAARRALEGGTNENGL